jgi:NAD-dependent deacetylase
LRIVKNIDKIFPINRDINVGDLAEDGTQLHPHIVWFEESVPMIEKAAFVMQTADVFILVGTSLQVYPAAGLIDFVPADTPKYIIDKVIPEVGKYENVIAIEGTATEGVGKLKKILHA